MDDRKLLALARRNAARAQHDRPKARFGRTYDPTVTATQPAGERELTDDLRTQRLFQDMKAREF